VNEKVLAERAAKAKAKAEAKAAAEAKAKAEAQVKKLPEHSYCSDVCPGCESPTCTCPQGACWPGLSVSDTPDPTCNCFAKLGFCKDGEEPVYKVGEECPSCWPGSNKACMCFAKLGFCGAEEAKAKADAKAAAEAKPQADKSANDATPDTTVSFLAATASDLTKRDAVSFNLVGLFVVLVLSTQAVAAFCFGIYPSSIGALLHFRRSDSTLSSPLLA